MTERVKIVKCVERGNQKICSLTDGGYVFIEGSKVIGVYNTTEKLIGKSIDDLL